jgi:hypothetical protein
MFSNVICIGDSYTNEHECYEAMGYDKKFIELDYEFKSYPQILGEYYDCKWETFGKPGMPMPYSLQILIDKIDYIQELENPLVIYQFGFFDNVIMSEVVGKYTDWKEINEDSTTYNFQKSNNHANLLKEHTFHTLNKHSKVDFFDMDKMEKLGMVTFLEKFGAKCNFHLIEQFLAIAKLIKRTSNIDIYGLFMAHNENIKVPLHNNLLYMGKDGYALDGKERICDIFPQQLGDTHKSTKANQQISEEIYKILLKKYNPEEYTVKYGNLPTNII